MEDSGPVLPVPSVLYSWSFISTYFHASVHRRVGVTCVGREKSKVQSGFVALIYSAAAGCCPVIMCRGGKKEVMEKLLPTDFWARTCCCCLSGSACP